MIENNSLDIPMRIPQCFVNVQQAVEDSAVIEYDHSTYIQSVGAIQCITLDRPLREQFVGIIYLIPKVTELDELKHETYMRNSLKRMASVREEMAKISYLGRR
jgi:hypothetical protein